MRQILQDMGKGITSITTAPNAICNPGGILTVTSVSLVS